MSSAQPGGAALAERYGLEHCFIVLCREEIVTSEALSDEFLALVREDAEYFNSSARSTTPSEFLHAAPVPISSSLYTRYQHQLDRGLTPSQTLRPLSISWSLRPWPPRRPLAQRWLPVHKATPVIQGLPKLAY
jgi:hypothetical protein